VNKRAGKANMYKLKQNRLWVGKTNQGTPIAFTLEHVVSLAQNPYSAHIVFVRLDSGDFFVVEHPDGLKGVLEGFDINDLPASWPANTAVAA